MSETSLAQWHNAQAREDAAPLITVAVPFHAYDVAPLARELVQQAQPFAERIELLFADDGSPASHWREDLMAVLELATVAGRVLSAPRNLGRSAIRNRLIAAARGEYLLFIDSDMLPDAPDYLARYLKLAEGSDVVYGGRSYRRATHITAEQRLYHYFSSRSECRPAFERQREPARYVMTNNLLVRRALLATLPFAEDYQSWGYEDTDWAMGLDNVAILHVDNSASHMGLIGERALLDKMDESRANFLRIAACRPAFHQLPAYRAARCAARMPGSGGLAWCCRQAALARWLSLPLRYAAVQGYRLAIYAAALRTAS